MKRGCLRAAVQDDDDDEEEEEEDMVDGSQQSFAGEDDVPEPRQQLMEYGARGEGQQRQQRSWRHPSDQAGYGMPPHLVGRDSPVLYAQGQQQQGVHQQQQQSGGPFNQGFVMDLAGQIAYMMGANGAARPRQRGASMGAMSHDERAEFEQAKSDVRELKKENSRMHKIGMDHSKQLSNHFKDISEARRKMEALSDKNRLLEDRISQLRSTVNAVEAEVTAAGVPKKGGVVDMVRTLVAAWTSGRRATAPVGTSLPVMRPASQDPRLVHAGHGQQGGVPQPSFFQPGDKAQTFASALSQGMKRPRMEDAAHGNELAEGAQGQRLQRGVKRAKSSVVLPKF